jgi:hypothetical protein
MTTVDYLIEMKPVPTGTVLSPAEGAAFTERFVLPTLEACERLVASGKIVAGGPLLGTTTFSFILRAESAQEAEAMVTSLPFWPRTQTSLVPLGSFEQRAAAVRQRLAAGQAAAARSVPSSTSVVQAVTS